MNMNEYDEDECHLKFFSDENRVENRVAVLQTRAGQWSITANL